jgi:hypothetical protein
MTRCHGSFDLARDEDARPFTGSSDSPVNTLDCLATHLRVFSKSGTPGSEGARTGQRTIRSKSHLLRKYSVIIPSIDITNCGMVT